MARSGDEVAELVESLSAEQARAIGTAGQRRILAEHTYAHRARQVADILVRLDWSISGVIVVTRDWLLPGTQVEVPAGAIGSIHRARRVLQLRYTEAQMRRLPRAGWRLRAS